MAAGIGRRSVSDLELSSAGIPARGSRLRLDEWRRGLGRLRRHPLLIVGSVMVLVIAVISLLPGVFATYDPLKIGAGTPFTPPSREHLFGTDELGRDLYSRVVYGTRLSASAGLFVVLGATALGAAVGTYAGFRGGVIDNLFMRAADVFLAFPGLVMAMAFVAALGPGLRNALLALILIWWPQYARLVRGQVLVLKQLPFVESARASGARDARILGRHMLPNFLAPLFVKGTLDIGHAILLAAGLSFLGLGAQPPEPELGALVTAGRVHILTAWWYSTLPGLTIFVAVLAINLVGDGLRDLLDPSLRRA